MIGSSHPCPSYQQHITTINGIIPTLQNIVHHHELRLSFGPQNHHIALAPTQLQNTIPRLVLLTNLPPQARVLLLSAIAFCHHHHLFLQPQNDCTLSLHWGRWSWQVPSMKTIHDWHRTNTCASGSMQSFQSSKSKISLAVVISSSQSN